MIRLAAPVVLLILLFSWKGNQLYTTIEKYFTHTSTTESPNPEGISYKMPGFNMPVYEKVIDADDFAEFSSSGDQSNNEIVVNELDGLSTDRATNENKDFSNKFYNRQYLEADSRLAKYHCTDSSLELPDRYLLKIPEVFLSPIAHPPQIG